jgi:hypothetical protein
LQVLPGGALHDDRANRNDWSEQEQKTNRAGQIGARLVGATPTNRQKSG